MRVPINEIMVTAGRRQLQPDKVRAIADSILEIGLLNPITIGPDKVLIAGLHRLEACKLAGLAEIECIVLEYDELRRELAEIDENLMRADLTMLEQGLCLARRKDIYEGLHPETRQGGDRKSEDYKSSGQVGRLIPPTFASDASGKTGESERTIRRRTSLGERLEMFADLIRGTPLEDNQSELQALAKLDNAEIMDVLETIRAGKADSVKGAKRYLKEQKREEKREANRQLVQETTPLSDVTIPKCSTIVLDPPWDWGDEGDQDQLGRARPTYATMTIEEIAALPVGDLVTDNAHIYLWITNRSLPKGFALLERWGFRYICALTWCKPSFGMGNYFRGQTEHVLFGVRGSLPLLRADVGTWFAADRPGKHSGKPNEFYTLAEQCSPGPWLEMFQRKARPGWYGWGAEADATSL